MSLAEQLKRLRLAKGHTTARGFASALGISENRYSRYERGEAVPKLDLVWSICAELGITPNELYGWESHGATEGYARHHSAQTTPGLAKSGASEELSPVAGDRAASSTAVDLAAWQLAAALAEGAGHAVGTGSRADADGKLRAMRATAELFLQLKRSPFETLARCLQTLDLDMRPAQAEGKIAGEVQAYLAALDRSASKTEH